jgi:single-stranded-DNA-specific exonuclease
VTRSALAPAPSLDDPPLLGVERSAAGRRWLARAAEPGLVSALARHLALPTPLAAVLVGRGVTLETGARFLSPSLRTDLPDPSLLAGMEAAVTVLSDAIDERKRIAVFADYDVDGATSAAQLIRYFRARGLALDLYVPDRIAEGYGPSGQAFSALKNRGADVVVTVDCGAMAHEALRAAQGMGLEIVVLDHHQMTADLPPAAAVVNPNRPDCGSGCGHLSAAGVTFLTMVALNREGRRRGAFKTRPEPDLLALLDLTALGTIADVVPLVGVNRALTAQGLKVMSRLTNPGLAALAQVAQAKGAASVYHAGFIYGPRINAGGRIGRADLGARLLSTDDPEEAARIAAELDALNTERRDMERQVTEEAIAQIEGDSAKAQASVLVAAGEGWHPGVIGIAAGRLKERFNKPAVVIALPEGGEREAKGSGRSVSGVDLGGRIAAARDAGLLIAGGGHAMAAGLTVARERVTELAAYLSAAVDAAGGVPQPTLMIDALVAPAGAGRELADAVAEAGPFGAGNPEPVFALADLTVRSRRTVGTDHLRVSLEDAGGARVDAVAFRALGGPVGELLSAPGARLHAAVKIKPGKGRFVDIQIEDVAMAETSSGETCKPEA